MSNRANSSMFRLQYLQSGTVISYFKVNEHNRTLYDLFSIMCLTYFQGTMKLILHCYGSGAYLAHFHMGKRQLGLQNTNLSQFSRPLKCYPVKNTVEKNTGFRMKLTRYFYFDCSSLFLSNSKCHIEAKNVTKTCN